MFQYFNDSLFLYLVLHLSIGQQQSCQEYESENSKDFSKCKENIKFCKAKPCEPNQLCMTVYKRPRNNANLQLKLALCVKNAEDYPIDEGKCVLRHLGGDWEHHYQCFCSGPLCNANIVFPPSSK